MLSRQAARAPVRQGQSQLEWQHHVAAEARSQTAAVAVAVVTVSAVAVAAVTLSTVAAAVTGAASAS